VPPCRGRREQTLHDGVSLLPAELELGQTESLADKPAERLENLRLGKRWRGAMSGVLPAGAAGAAGAAAFCCREF